MALPTPQILGTAGAALDKATKNVEVQRNTLLAIAADNASKTADALASSDEAWYQPKIDTIRWDKLYPYQLIVVEAYEKNGKTSYRPFRDFRYTLPVPPESITFSMPFANQLSATLGGVIEERNGAPFRMIQLRSTTGVLPGRSSPVRDGGTSFLSAAFGGTILATQNTVQSLTNAGNALTGRGPLAYNVHDSSEFESVEDKSNLASRTTGYYQILLLKRFFEAYASICKTDAGAKLRMALCVWKEQEVYLVSPQSLETQKNGGSPLETTYVLGLKAFKRVALNTNDLGFVQPINVRRDPNKLAKLLTTLRETRNTVQGVSKIAAAVVGDIKKLVYEPIRESILLLKDMQGATKTVADLPENIVKGVEEAYHRAVSKETTSLFVDIRSQQQEAVRAGDSSVGVNRQRPTPFTTDTTVGGVSRGRIPAFQDPLSNAQMLDTIDLSTLKLSPEVRAAIDEETKRVNDLSRKDYEEKANGIRRAAAQLSISVGAGNSTYEELYQISAPQIKTTPTDGDWEAIYALEAAAQAMMALAASAPDKSSAMELRFEAMAQLAQKSGIAFQIPTSKFAVPFPYGVTLDRLAQQYLGDPNRWMEIATLNGLQHPYIDEVGFTLALTSNSVENQLVVAKTSQLSINKLIYVISKTKRRVSTRIVDLKNVGDYTYITTSTDVSGFTTYDDSKIEAFLDNTINSRQLIYIPSSDDPGVNPWITKSIPGVDDFDPFLAVGGVDFLLDQDNNLIFTPEGDVLWAVGLTNIIQNYRVIFSLRPYDLIDHPDLGLDVQPGMSVADLDPNKVIQAVRKMLSNDASISRIDAIQVKRSANAAGINLGITLNGASQPVAIAFGVG